MSSQMSLNELSQFYNHFSELDQAGINYITTIESLNKNEKKPERNRQFQFIIQHLKKSRPLSDVFRFLKFVPVYDVPMIKAAEDSGRLVQVFKMLSKKYAEAALAEKNIRSQMVKPYLTFIVALFVPTFPKYFSHQITLLSYLKSALIPLAVVSGLSIFIFEAWKKSYYEIEMAKLLHKILSMLPFFRGLSRQIAYQKYSNALGMMIDSGLDLFESLNQASLCSAEPQIREATLKIIPMIKKGVSIEVAFKTEKEFPVELLTAIDLGTQSGKLPEFLERYSVGLRQEIDRKIQIFSKALPVVMYWIVTFYVGSIIIQFYQSHLNDINQVLEQN